MAVVPTQAQPAQEPAEEKTIKINLLNDITISNVHMTRVFKAGQGVEVPEAMAEDIQRIDYEHQQYKDNLNKKRVFEVNAGTMAVGSGAE